MARDIIGRDKSLHFWSFLYKTNLVYLHSSINPFQFLQILLFFQIHIYDLLQGGSKPDDEDRAVSVAVVDRLLRLAALRFRRCGEITFLLVFVFGFCAIDLVSEIDCCILFDVMCV